MKKIVSILFLLMIFTITAVVFASEPIQYEIYTNTYYYCTEHIERQGTPINANDLLEYIASIISCDDQCCESLLKRIYDAARHNLYVYKWGF